MFQSLKPVFIGAGFRRVTVGISANEICRLEPLYLKNFDNNATLVRAHYIR